MTKDMSFAVVCGRWKNYHYHLPEILVLDWWVPKDWYHWFVERNSMKNLFNNEIVHRWKCQLPYWKKIHKGRRNSWFERIVLMHIQANLLLNLYRLCAEIYLEIIIAFFSYLWIYGNMILLAYFSVYCMHSFSNRIMIII